MQKTIDEDISQFKNRIESNRIELEKGIRERIDVRFLLIYDGTNYLALLNNTLYALKSFLDIYANLMSKLISKGFNCGFNKGCVNGQKLSGGRFINALINNGQQSLAELTFNHSIRWISEAVNYRDQLSHRSDLVNMQLMQLPLHHEPPHINYNDLVHPAMPNGQDLASYCDLLVNNLKVYICDSIMLLPNINFKMISTERFMDSVV